MRSASSIAAGCAYDQIGKNASCSAWRAPASARRRRPWPALTTNRPARPSMYSLPAAVPDAVSLALDDDRHAGALGHDRLAGEVHPEVVAGHRLQLGLGARGADGSVEIDMVGPSCRLTPTILGVTPRGDAPAASDRVCPRMRASAAPISSPAPPSARSPPVSRRSAAVTTCAAPVSSISPVVSGRRTTLRPTARIAPGSTMRSPPRDGEREPRRRHVELDDRLLPGLEGDPRVAQELRDGARDGRVDVARVQLHDVGARAGPVVAHADRHA